MEGFFMKKILAGIFTALTTIILCLVIAGCSSSVAGTYKFESITTTVGETSTTVKVGDEYGGTTLTADYMVYELKSDNTFTGTMGGSETSTGTWEEKDGKVIITVDSTPVEFTFSNNKLTMTQTYSGSTTTIVLVKS
jgi:sucrose-6-phosphate hydrolase SacC (GH32 family)